MRNLPLRKRELLGMAVGLAVAALVVTVGVVATGNYENLGDRSLPFFIAPGAGLLGALAGLAVADGKPVPDVVQSLLRRPKKAG